MVVRDLPAGKRQGTCRRSFLFSPEFTTGVLSLSLDLPLLQVQFTLARLEDPNSRQNTKPTAGGGGCCSSSGVAASPDRTCVAVTASVSPRNALLLPRTKVIRNGTRNKMMKVRWVFSAVAGSEEGRSGWCPSLACFACMGVSPTRRQIKKTAPDDLSNPSWKY